MQPPGKVIKNLAALSGGEQAFVAIAIYFAILKVNPAPFCLLDEIEAALDDVNVDPNIARYLRSMSGKTQFIAITHRRGTMEEADVLYGVTMQEEGVSKLHGTAGGRTGGKTRDRCGPECLTNPVRRIRMGFFEKISATG